MFNFFLILNLVDKFFLNLVVSTPHIDPLFITRHFDFFLINLFFNKKSFCDLLSAIYVWLNL